MPRPQSWAARALMVVLAAQVVVGAVYVFAVPLWQGHEADFYNVTRFWVEQGRLPTADDYPHGDAEIHQATQPPLYFAAAYPLVALFQSREPVPPGAYPPLACFGDGGANAPLIPYPISAGYRAPFSGEVIAGYGLRLLNLLIGTLATVFTYAAGRRLFPIAPGIALAGAALLAFEGNLLRLNSSINNDTLFLALSAANLYGCAGLLARLNRRSLGLVLVTLVLALLTRLSGWALLLLDLPFVVIVSLIAWRGSLRRQWRHLLALIALFVLVGAGIIAFNQISYGSPFGRYSFLVDAVRSTLAHFELSGTTLGATLGQTYSAFQEPLALLAPRAIFVQLYGLALVIALLGIGWAFARATACRARESGSLALLVGMIAAGAGLVIFRNLLEATPEVTTTYNAGFVFAPLRYYGAALPAAALLISAGLAALVPEHGRLRHLNPFGIALAGGWLVVTVLGAALAIRDLPPQPVITPAELAARSYTTPTGNQPDDLPHVIGYRIEPQPDAGFVHLMLYLSASAPLSLDSYGEVTLASAGDAVSTCQFVPARGAYPTSLWQRDRSSGDDLSGDGSSGEIVAAQVVVPNCAFDADTPVTLSLRWLGATADGAWVEGASSPPLNLGTVTGLVRASSCPANLGVVGGGYQIVKLNTPETVRRGETYLPSVNWLVLEPVEGAATQALAFTHAASGQTYTCIDQQPTAVFAVPNWRRGDTVYFDVCPMQFPPDAPLGKYQVAAGIVDAAGAYLPATSANGEPLPGGVVDVGMIEVVP